MTEVKPPAKDPMKGFRGVQSGALIMEAITVALALPVIAQFGGGIGSGKGWTVIGLAVALVACCWIIKRPWAVPVVLVLQLGLIAFFFAVPAIAVIGVVFLCIWLWLVWLRRDVAKRMAEGRLPSQQV